ncbi:MAG: restriction endonuclease [Burkholderiaceae bacterium]|nr:restriction endonuclease [Burkholderiaceae bacterium]
MKQGYLSQYFAGAGVKRLSKVEADTIHSNQHEFNGVRGLRALLGEPEGHVRYPARFLYLNDQDDEPVADEGFLTWYEARQRARIEKGVQRWEYRLYFPTNLVSQCAAEGDLLVIAKQSDGGLLAIVAESGSTIERQLLWLFGFGELTHPGFSVKSELETEQDRLGFAARVVLETIGIEVVDEAPNYLDEMLRLFGGAFPKRTEFSDYARRTLRDIDPHTDSDSAIVAWMEREEVLFRTLEKHLLAERLQKLKDERDLDPEAFMSLMQSAQQRRKSRAGGALENHLEALFTAHHLTYTREGITERKLKPDFIFPGIGRYHDANFDAARLTMLAAKTTCKDRWRQILNEAAKIPLKHLITLEPRISEGQTDEMRAENVQLVLPSGLHPTFTGKQQAWLMDVSDFLKLVRSRQ